MMTFPTLYKLTAVGAICITYEFSTLVWTDANREMTSLTIENGVGINTVVRTFGKVSHKETAYFTRVGNRCYRFLGRFFGRLVFGTKLSL